MEKLNTFIILFRKLLNNLDKDSEINVNYIDDDKFQLSKEGSRKRILILLCVFAIILNIFVSTIVGLMIKAIRESKIGTPVILTSKLGNFKITCANKE